MQAMTVDPALLLLADGRLPTGGHAHAAGVEAAARLGDVHDTDSLERYLRARLATTGRVDAAFAAGACAAMATTTAEDMATAATAAGTGDGDRVGDGRRLVPLDAEYSARTPSPYLRDVSRRLGRQLLRTAATMWPGAPIDGVRRWRVDPHHPIVLGATCAAAGASPSDAAVLALHHLGGAVTTGGVRLLGLDPIDLARRQLTAVADAVDHVLPTLDPDAPPAALPASAGTLTEILGEHHGSLDARLFVA